MILYVDFLHEIQVTDPVQLVCSKGGDLSLLRAVASLDYTEESSDIPCMSEQRDTLRVAMSKPQVGFTGITFKRLVFSPGHRWQYKNFLTLLLY